MPSGNTMATRPVPGLREACTRSRNTISVLMLARSLILLLLRLAPPSPGMDSFDSIPVAFLDRKCLNLNCSKEPSFFSTRLTAAPKGGLVSTRSNLPSASPGFSCVSLGKNPAHHDRQYSYGRHRG